MRGVPLLVQIFARGGRILIPPLQQPRTNRPSLVPFSSHVDTRLVEELFDEQRGSLYRFRLHSMAKWDEDGN